MKAPSAPPSYALSGFVGMCLLCLFGITGCINKPAARPSQLYSTSRSSGVGGPMRVAADTPTPRTPPHLPIIVKDASVDADKGMQPPPPPPPTLKSAAVPNVVSSPVPNQVDGYFAPAPAQTSALGVLFGSIFVPPTPTTPTTTSSAKYQEVK